MQLPILAQVGGVTFERRHAYLQLVSSYLHVLDSTLPTGHVSGRHAAPSTSAPATADSAAAKSGSRAHTGYLPRVDDMLGLTEASPQQQQQQQHAEAQPGAAYPAAEDDPFAASAAVLPEGLLPGDSAGVAAHAEEGTAVGADLDAATSGAAEMVLPPQREHQLLQDDSDSDLEADIAFAHVMARRGSATAHAHAPEAGAPDLAGPPLAASSTPPEPAQAAGAGKDATQRGVSQQPAAGVTSRGEPEQATAAPGSDMGAASQQTQDINSRLMALLIHSSPAAADLQAAKPGTSHASLPPPEANAAAPAAGGAGEQEGAGIAAAAAEGGQRGWSSVVRRACGGGGGDARAAALPEEELQRQAGEAGGQGGGGHTGAARGQHRACWGAQRRCDILVTL